MRVFRVLCAMTFLSCGNAVPPELPGRDATVGDAPIEAWTGSCAYLNDIGVSGSHCPSAGLNSGGRAVS